MTPKTMRSFATGLLVAGGALGFVYYTSDTKQANSAEQTEATIEDMHESLTEAGFVVQEQEEWNQMERDLEEALAAAENATDSDDEGNNEVDEEERIVYRTILHVVAGMTSIDVGNMLEEAGIVDSGYDFYEEVENRGLSNELRPQVTGELTSEMSLSEVVDAFF
ncbi:hypothetical protein [Shouchella patagoniensis]|uniref:hypothetical protein n=1 Tax=Shouchella patagoniensis TaxID=228576 RepID=UPI000995057A|nr:hypothetical protein [Shouchella patagoniensis]